MGSSAKDNRTLTNPNAGREAGVVKYQTNGGHDYAWGDKWTELAPQVAADIRAENARRASLNFYNREGGRSTNAYERAEQDRRLFSDKEWLRFADPRSPEKVLQDKLGSEAYAYRKGVGRAKVDAADDIRAEAGGLIDRGVKQIRTGANSRGLLHSGMRQGAEGDYRAKVAGAMSKNIADSNKELSSRADAMDRIAAESALKGAQASAEAKARLDQISRESAVARAQRLQQLTGAIGYGMGSYFGNREKKPETTQAPSGLMGGGSYRDYGNVA